MSDPIIDAASLSKAYKLYSKPSDRLKEALHPLRRSYHQEHFVLRDISFSVQKGEMIGILGRNGAGKSTLLKLLTKVLYPSGGSLAVKGRVASLLELGAGFNPELTGKENIYFFGLLNGITREDIDVKFNSIVEFADIGKYIDQPVKTYSSGMFVRLAFASVIHIDPDILIIDEALSVGDARFQRKCFKRISELKANKTTILLVSHDLETIKKHCTRALLLEDGRLLFDGEPKDAVMKYFDILYPNEVQDSAVKKDLDDRQVYNQGAVEICPDELSSTSSFGYGGARVDFVKIYGAHRPNIFPGGESVNVEISFSWDIEVVRALIKKESLDQNISIGFAVSDRGMNYIFGCNTFDSGLRIDPFAKNSSTVALSFTLPMLKNDDYFLTLAIAVGSLENHIQMKWYDGIGVIRVKTLKEVYGSFAVDYEYKVLER